MSSATSTSARFEGRWCPLGSINISTNISPDRQAATFLFASFQTEVRDEDPVPAARVMTIRLPVVENATGVRVAQDLRGFVQAEDGARVSLVIESGGAAKVIDLVAARAPEPVKGAACDQPRIGGYNFQARVEATVMPGWDYYATIILVAERTAGAARAMVQFDSLDVSLLPPE